jgi:hypothetical protein
MGSRPQILAFSAGFLVASLLAAAFVFAAREGAERSLAWPQLAKPGSEPVLIVVVGDAVRVDLVRSAVDRERIIFETASAFALRERRIIAGSFEEVGPMLMRAGWRDDPLEIVTLGPASTRSPVAQTDKLADLMNKPTLNIVEARMVLNSL